MLPLGRSLGAHLWLHRSSAGRLPAPAGDWNDSEIDDAGVNVVAMAFLSTVGDLAKLDRLLPARKNVEARGR